jgi:hypothetical protein
MVLYTKDKFRLTYLIFLGGSLCQKQNIKKEKMVGIKRQLL